MIKADIINLPPYYEFNRVDEKKQKKERKGPSSAVEEFRVVL